MRSSRIATPCLDEWRQRGDLKTRDALWRASCWEARAVELAAQGFHGAAQECIERAREEWSSSAALARPVSPEERAAQRYAQGVYA
jgi:hypothetical protein